MFASQMQRGNDKEKGELHCSIGKTEKSIVNLSIEKSGREIVLRTE